MSDGTCACGHGAGTAHQGGTGACIGYVTKGRYLVRCRCQQYREAK